MTTNDNHQEEGDPERALGDNNSMIVKRENVTNRQPHWLLRKEENSKMWFRFEMLRMFCVIFIACMSIFLREDTMPTRPLPNHFTQIGTIHNMRKNMTNRNATTLLSVPFYVYESLIWDNMTFQGQNLSEMLTHTPLKHSEDYWFMKAALVHPMRTMDPEMAQLFVVPALMNFATDGIALTKQAGASRRQYGACNGALCNDQLVEQVEMVLAESPYYQRSNGSNHIMVLSNWYSSHHAQIVESPIFPTLNLIRYEDHILNSNRTSFAGTLVGNPCPNSNSTNKMYDFALLTSESQAKRPRIIHKLRPDVCTWLKEYNTSVCGQADSCSAVAESRYAFYVSGDTISANNPRLLDIILSGTVPIFTQYPQQAALLPYWIDWNLLSLQMNVTSKEEFVYGVQGILNFTEYEEKRNHVLANRDLLDWRTGVAFDVYMFMFQRELLPQSVDSAKLFNPYNYSALKI